MRRRSFLLPVKVLSKRFRSLLCDELRRACKRGQLRRAAISELVQLEALLGRACRTDWVVYAKPPFGGPSHVLAYLSAYTHRIAISNRRLVAFDGKRVTFRWRDYADGSRPKLLTLDGHEFLRRFLLHVLPDRFVRIRYVGFLGNRHRVRNLTLVRERIGQAPPELPREPDPLPILCPACAAARAATTMPTRAPPAEQEAVS